MLAESDITQENICKFAKKGKLGKLKIICEYLDVNGKNAEYNLDIAGYRPNYFWDYSDNYVIRYACSNGRIDIVKYLMENWSHLIDITAIDNYAINFAYIYNYINIINYLIAVSIKKILDNGIHTDDINNIINLLVYNDCIYEYYLLTDELKKRKIIFDCCEKIEKLIEKKRNLCAQIECHPGLIGGQIGINCEEGFEKVVKLLEKK